MTNIGKKIVLSLLGVALMLPGTTVSAEDAVYTNDEYYYNQHGIYGDADESEPLIPPPIQTWTNLPIVPAGLTIPALDMTVNYIPFVQHPAASVIFVGAPQGVGAQIYTIMASSPITGVERMLLEDNRLIIDIINSNTTLSGALPVPPFMAVSGMRVSQFTDTTTRVVFDLESGTEFNITISPDRTTIFLTIHQHTLQDASFEIGDEHESIVLTGVRPSAIRVQPGPGQLRFYLSNVQTAAIIDELPLEGAFATYMSLSQWSIHTALLEVRTHEFTAHTIVQTGANETTVFFSPATYRNIHYSFDERTFRIPRTNDFVMGIENVVRQDLYHQHQFILWLPIDASEHIGFGEVLVADSLLHSLTIAHTGFNTQFIFSGNQIFALDLQADDDYYIIRIMHPRERYSRIVIIDPGHGGRDPGAVRSGVRESDLNMLVTNKLLQLINQDGLIKAYTTRNTDVFVGLQDRAHFGNNIGDLFVSIHFNAATGTHVHGIETYFRESLHDSFRQLTSRNFADIMHRHKLNILGSNDRAVRSANFAVLRYSTIPAVLLEMGFMSNPYEFARIQTAEFQWQAARAIYNGLLESFMWVPR